MKYNLAVSGFLKTEQWRSGVGVATGGREAGTARQAATQKRTGASWNSARKSE